MPHIYLIGFMCAGKSTVGKALALLLDRPFIDLDRVIEKQVGPLLPFVQERGEAAFRDRERTVMAEVSEMPAAVVATGGGTPTVAANWERMQRTGTVVWLDAAPDVLLPRIERAGGDRPLLFGLRGEALRQRVLALLEERLAVYQQAHFRVAAHGTPQEVAERIARRLGDQLR